MANSRERKAQRFHSALWNNQWVIRRTVAELERREMEFRREHREDTDEQLLEYVRREAAAFGVTPCAQEMIGGAYIAGRFGGWKRAVEAAGLKPPHTLPPLNRRKIYKREFKRQALLFKRECACQKDMETLWEGRRMEAANDKNNKGVCGHVKSCVDQRSESCGVL